MNWAQYEQILLKREEDTRTILTEAEKHYRQAQANYENAKRERAAWMESTEELMKGMEQSGIYTEQENDGTRDTLSQQG